MLLQLYPKVHRRYSSLPVLGPVVEKFGAYESTPERLRTITALDIEAVVRRAGGR